MQYILDIACDDAGAARAPDGSFAPFGITIDEDGKIETLSFPATDSATSVLQSESTSITTAVAIVSPITTVALSIHIDFRDGVPLLVRAPYHLKKRLLRKPEIELEAKETIETMPAERIIDWSGS